MTLAARETLEDCRGALAELTDGVKGGQWRRRWIIAIVLLRAVGQVLDSAMKPCLPFSSELLPSRSGVSGTRSDVE